MKISVCIPIEDRPGESVEVSNCHIDHERPILYPAFER